MTTSAAQSAAEAVIAAAAPLERTDPTLDLSTFVRPVIALDEYDSLFGFGDSLVDSGAAARLIDTANDLTGDAIDLQTPPDKGYFENRFSNGPNYFDRLYSEITGAAPESYLNVFDVIGEIGETFELPDETRGGVNFSIGGSTAISAFGFEGPEIVEGLVPDLDLQVSLFETGLKERPRADRALDVLDDVFGVEIDLPRLPNDALIALNFGGNDIFAFLDQNPELEFTDEELAAFSQLFNDAYRDALDDMIDLGATSFLIAGAVNGGAAPDVVSDLFPGDTATTVETVQPVVDALNEGLRDLLAEISAENPDVEIFFFEPDITEPLENPDAFGLDPDLISVPFIDELDRPNSGVTLDDLPQYAFIDDFHPTTVGQDLLFDQSLAAQQIDTSLETLTEGSGLLEGGRGRDAILGENTNDWLRGLGSSDVLDGGDGADTVDGHAGDDLLVGGAGADLIRAGAGDDAAFGGSGVDLLFGGSGDDVLNGGADTDRLNGQAGDDLVDGDAGNDRLFGGEGADTFIFTGVGALQRDVILDFELGVDRIDLRAPDGSSLSPDEVDAILATARDVPVGAVFRFGDGDRVAIKDVAAADLTDEFFLFA